VAHRLFDGGVLVEEIDNPSDAEFYERSRVRAQILADLHDGLETNRALAAQNAAIISAAQAIEDFTGTTLTQAQIIATLKQLATGVRVLAQHDQVALVQRNYLGRLALAAFDATD
jgi:hypothetical protein